VTDGVAHEAITYALATVPEWPTPAPIDARVHAYALAEKAEATRRLPCLPAGAGAAAARSCPEVARTLWSLILEEYTGPEHAEIRQRAKAALHQLDTTPTRRPR
jgi:hypothetical protein